MHRQIHQLQQTYKEWIKAKLRQLAGVSPTKIIGQPPSHLRRGDWEQLPDYKTLQKMLKLLPT
jgi:hypothetical protein